MRDTKKIWSNFLAANLCALVPLWVVAFGWMPEQVKVYVRSFIAEPVSIVADGTTLLGEDYGTWAIERLGTGLEDLFRVCREAGLPKPTIEVLNGEFHITVFRKHQGRFPRQESRQESMTLAARVLAVLADGPRSRAEISRALGQKKISGQLNRVLADLLDSGKIVRTVPEKPNSRLQKYGVFP